MTTTSLRKPPATSMDGEYRYHVLRAAIEAGAPIVSFTPEEGRLRDVFVTLAGEAEGAKLDEEKISAKDAA